MLSSEGHRSAPREGIQFDNLDRREGLRRRWRAYGQSKIANLLFAKELRAALRRHEEDGQRGAPGHDRDQPGPPHPPGRASGCSRWSARWC